jgi:hypothetical protein
VEINPQEEHDGGIVMSEIHEAPDDHHEHCLYEIRLKGHLDYRWADRFEGMSFIHESDGTTILYGPIVDQAELHGMLRKVRDLGLPLVSVIQIDPRQITFFQKKERDTNEFKS